MESRIKVSYVKHCPGHKNSKGQSAPWCILSHKDNKILSSHSIESEAKKHLQQMHAHSGSFINVRNIDELISGGTYEQCNIYRN